MNYSFRKKNKTVKYIVIHYTGMRDLKSAFFKLNHHKSDVSSHYLISRLGIIYNLICPSLKAWHAGISQWKKDKNLNDLSIGIELENKGHEYGYVNFTNKQYESLKILINFLIYAYRIKNENIIYHSDISPNRKKDPGEKFDINKINIKRFKKDKITKNISLLKMLNIYGFSEEYINFYFYDCIVSVKRAMGYKFINSKINSRFEKDFYNLLFR
tara:strand:+ start:584 stop:1225 length:642 start_codon:yes stop_codon:yes gene_type:complete